MSGNPTGSNVVPMPHVAAPAQAFNAQQPPMPFPMWGGGGSLPWGPGCCPPGGMDALMKCYCDVQAATAFICSVMVQCIQTNPAVTAAIIAAIEASGSTLPLLGVTNGTEAQPGQVGEFVHFSIPLSYLAANQSYPISVGVLQPGDWDVWAQLSFMNNPDIIGAYFILAPVPVGLSGDMYTISTTSGPLVAVTIPSEAVQALISVPTLIAMSVTINSPSAGNALFEFSARRRR